MSAGQTATESGQEALGLLHKSGRLMRSCTGSEGVYRVESVRTKWQRTPPNSGGALESADSGAAIAADSM